MSKVKNTLGKIKSKIETVKKLNDDTKNTDSTSVADKLLNDVQSSDVLSGKKLDGFLDKRKRKKNNKKDIFAELVDIANQFLDVKKSKDKYDVNKPVDNFYDNFNKRRLRTHAIASATLTINKSREIVSKNVKKVFFADGAESICGADSTLSVDTIQISPKEFDILNILTVDPTTTTGKIVYEPETPDTGKQKTNRELYNIFSGGVYSYDTNNNKTLFDVSWNSGTQKFEFSGLTQGAASVRVDSFLSDYYSSLEFPSISSVTKNAMQQIMPGNNGQSYEFNKAQNEIERLLKKLFSICGQQKNRNALENQNAIDQFDENDEDFSFDFDDVEGIDLDSEDARLRGVLKFTDCNNFESPVNSDFIKDFVYLSNRKTLDESLDALVNRAATEAFENSDGSIQLENFRLSLFNSFILQLPKALISSVISAKVFLPVIIVYKIIKSLTASLLEVKELFKKLKKLVYFIVRDLFWKFLQEFWKLIKRDLLQFLTFLVIKIIKNKYKRYLVIITALIALLRRISQTNINNCADLFGLILNTIDTALSARGGINVPGFLLGFSNQLPGYSQDRAFMNISERLAAAGIPTETINGESNDILSLVKSVVDGNTEEMDQNSFVSTSNNRVIIPSPVGPIIIPPGIINSSGKFF